MALEHSQSPSASHSEGGKVQTYIEEHFHAALGGLQQALKPEDIALIGVKFCEMGE